jgi:Family of unknown function (DUF5675)
MEMILTRFILGDKSTIGDLRLDTDENTFCQTLELPVKDGLPGSAIPPGRYQVTIAYSARFQRNMPLLVDVPNRSAIEMHWGDYPHNTEGCILTGQYDDKAPDQIHNTRATFDSFFPKMEGAASAGNCWLTVNGGIPSIPVQPVDLRDVTEAT